MANLKIPNKVLTSDFLLTDLQDDLKNLNNNIKNMVIDVADNDVDNTGINNASTSIQAVIDANTGKNITLLFSGIFKIDSTITLKPNIFYDFRNAVFNVIGNINPFKLTNNFEAYFGKINLQDGFTSDIFTYDSASFADFAPVADRLANIKMHHIVITSQNTLYTGIVFNAKATLGWGVWGISIKDVMVYGNMAYLINLQTENWLPETPENPDSYMATWFTECIFKDWQAAGCKNGIKLQKINAVGGDYNKVFNPSFNIFENIHIQYQAAMGADALLADVEQGNSNKFLNCIANDWLGTYVYKFAADTSENYVRQEHIWTSYINDLGNANLIDDPITYRNTAIRPDAMIFASKAAGHSAGNMIHDMMVGIQDDCFAFFNERGYTITPGSVSPSIMTSDLYGIFRHTVNYNQWRYAKADVLNGVSFTLNLSGGNLKYVNHILLTFNATNEKPIHIKVDKVNLSDVSSTVVDRDCNLNTLTELLTINQAKTVTITFSGGTSGGTYLELSSIMGTCTWDALNTEKSTFLFRNGGQMYGDIKFLNANGPVLTASDATKWRLGVTTAGALTITKI